MKKFSLSFLFAIFLLAGFDFACADDYNLILQRYGINNFERLVVVDFLNFHLKVFDVNGSEIGFSKVALPKRLPPNLPVVGKVAKIEENPNWYPTEATRQAYLRKKGILLPREIKFGSPLNAMGKGKVRIIFLTKGINPFICLHGTNDLSSIGKRVSRGCIRVEDIEKLKDLIRGKNTVIIFI